MIDGNATGNGSKACTALVKHRLGWVTETVTAASSLCAIRGFDMSGVGPGFHLAAAHDNVKESQTQSLSGSCFLTFCKAEVQEGLNRELT